MLRTIILTIILAMSRGPHPVDLTLNAHILPPRTTIQAKVVIEPDETNREACILWQSEDGEAGEHCWPQVGANAPHTTFYRFTIASPGEYKVTAYILKLQGTFQSNPQNLVITP